MSQRAIAQRAGTTATLITLSAVSFGCLTGCNERTPSEPGKASGGQTSSYRTDIPSNFTAQAKMISWGTQMYLHDGAGRFGTVEERTFNLTRTFEFFDEGRSLQARAREQAFTLGTKIEIVDGAGVPLGSVEESVLKSMFSLKTWYSVKDAQGQLLAESDKRDWAGTSVTIKTPEGGTVATMEHSMFDMGGATWTVHIDPEVPFDKRLVIFIPAFKTAADAARSN
jgi:hypothetical protein